MSCAPNPRGGMRRRNSAKMHSVLHTKLAELGLPLVNAAGGLSLTIPYGVVVPALGERADGLSSGGKVALARALAAMMGLVKHDGSGYVTADGSPIAEAGIAPRFRLADILKLMREHPELRAINSHVKQKAV